MTWMGYKLIRQIGSGAFGEVYEAQAPDKRHVAVKILHERVRKSSGMLQSFRRGVRSMRILSERRVQGMVAYREAYETPAFAVMDLIDGPNLADAVKAGKIKDWRTILKIAKGLASIIRTAHLLPERVLHRSLMAPRCVRGINRPRKHGHGLPRARTGAAQLTVFHPQRGRRFLSLRHDPLLHGHRR